MELETTGWPQLPTVGARIRFVGGTVVDQSMGECIIVRADHITNAVGKPAGRIWLQADRGELFEVTLSKLRNHAELIIDGLA
jgi:hypothetical protein